MSVLMLLYDLAGDLDIIHAELVRYRDTNSKCSA